MKGYIYKIEFGEYIYVGSTIQKLCERQKDHNYNLRTEKIKYKLYEVAREKNIGEIECILLKQVEFEEVENLRKTEEEYRVKLNANLNVVACYLSEEGKKEQKKEYREQNRDKINETFNCECGGKYTYTHKARHLKTKKHQNYININ